MADVALRVNGREYAGWKSARVTRGIESVSGSFELSVSDRWSGDAVSWPIVEGDECTVMVGGEVVITGYVDRRTISYSASEHTLSVSGRDRTGDLVDCSAVLTKWEFYSTPVLMLAKRLAEPFSISVTLQSGLSLPPPVAKLSVDPGDSVYEVIERACRTAALLAVADGRGGLLLMRPGSTRTTTALVEGENILAASAERDETGRFRRVVVRGQNGGTDILSGASVAAVQASAEDRNVVRAARVLLVRPEGNVTPAHAKQRAEWETTVRAARATTVTATVQGWTQSNGSLWPVNALARLRSPTLGLDAELLVTQAVYNVDESSGTTTQLTLRPPDAFKPEPVIPKKNKKTFDLGVE